MSEDKRFGWYDDDFVNFLLSLKLPAYRNEKPIRTAIAAEKERFISLFEEMLSKDYYRVFSEKFYSALKQCQQDIIDNFNLLIKTIELYDNAEMAAAQASFDALMERLLAHLLITDIFFPHHPSNFYRIRASVSKKLKEPRELFHISYKQRQLISNERYSLAGHPCLYLSSQLHIAWQECGFPHQFYYSEFQYQTDPSASDIDDWEFITFLSPLWIATNWFVAINPPEEKYIKIAVDYMISYPLIFACSIVNLNGHSAFKPEYVIPQMLTQWVYRNNDKIKGIKYFSCHDSGEDLRYNGYNVVLPAKNYDTRGYSKELIRKFKVSKPKLYINCPDDGALNAVGKYKDELLRVMSIVPRLAADCLYDFYRVANLLYKALKSWDKTDMGFVISAIQNVAYYGGLLLKNYDKKQIIQQCNNDPFRNSRLCANLSLYEKMYDAFPKNVIEIAESYDSVLKQETISKCTDFFDV